MRDDDGVLASNISSGDKPECRRELTRNFQSQSFEKNAGKSQLISSRLLSMATLRVSLSCHLYRSGTRSYTYTLRCLCHKRAATAIIIGNLGHLTSLQSLDLKVRTALRSPLDLCTCTSNHTAERRVFEGPGYIVWCFVEKQRIKAKRLKRNASAL